jgi:diadenosine tetraphosphate (Ap4A) HIT family hydrolase
VSLECLACQLTAGERELTGGRIFQTEHWVVEHCIGTLGVGTLILKPFRHIVGLADMSDAEGADLGPLMQRATSTIKALTGADQVIRMSVFTRGDGRPSPRTAAATSRRGSGRR